MIIRVLSSIGSFHKSDGMGMIYVRNKNCTASEQFHQDPNCEVKMKMLIMQNIARDDIFM